MEQTSFLGAGQQRRRTVKQTEAWLFGEGVPAAWGEGYLALRAKHVAHYDAMLAVWLSLARDDRGAVRTREDFARLMGVSRQTTYDWEARRPEIRVYAEWLQVLRLRGSRLAEVDERTYAAALEGTHQDRVLYYKRAGVWEEAQRVHLVGEGEGPVEYVDVSQEELDAIRDALQAKSGSAEG